MRHLIKAAAIISESRDGSNSVVILSSGFAADFQIRQVSGDIYAAASTGR